MTSNRIDANSLPPPNITRAGHADGVLNTMQGVMAGIKDICNMVAALISELQAEAAAKPQPPATAGMKKEDAAKAQGNYAQQLNQWQGRIDNLNKRLVDTQEKLQKEQVKLQKLQNTDLPAAQRADADSAKRQLDDAQKSLQSQVESMDSKNTDRSGGSAESSVEVRALWLKAGIIGLQVTRASDKPSTAAETATGAKVPPPAASGV